MNNTPNGSKDTPGGPKMAYSGSEVVVAPEVQSPTTQPAINITINITINTKRIYTSREMDCVLKSVWRYTTGWGEPSPQELDNIREALSHCGLKDRTPDGRGIRAHLITDANISSSQNTRLIQQAVKCLQSGMTLEMAVRTKRLPPLLILREYLLTSGFDGVIIRDMLRGGTCAISKYNTMVQYAVANDLNAPLRADRANEEAGKYEERVEMWLREHGVTYKTQATLMKEQMDLYGRAINTPDFLIIGPVHINGVRVHWIDAKNYLYTGISFLAKGLRKQAERYVKAYGNGAFLFSGGFLDEKIPGVLMAELNLTRDAKF